MPRARSSVDDGTLRLGPEGWGDRVHRAYRTARRTWPRVTYVRAARAVSEVVATTDTTLQRLEDLAEPPTGAQRRLVAWAYLTALGFDPADFDLGEDSVSFGAALSVAAARRALAPQVWARD